MNSKQTSLLLLLSLGVSNVSFSAPSCTSHAFVPRGISTDLTYINALTYYDVHVKEKDKWFTYVGQAIYSQSRKSTDLGAAFLTGTSNTLVVTQSPVAPVAANVVNSIGLGLGNTNLATPFSATFSIRPQSKFFAYHGYMYMNLDSWWCGLWADAAFAIVNRQNRLNCTEVDGTALSNICPGITTVGQALSNPAYNYSKFFCGLCDPDKRRTGFDDIQLRLGYDYTWCDNNVLGLYIIATIPGGRRPTAEFIFEPLVGSKHASLGVGLQGDYVFNLCGCEDASITLMTDANYRYVFSHSECRTFDLLPQGAFSRYLPLVNIASPMVTIPGVNLLTDRVKVTPRSTIQWWLGFNYEYCNMDFEVGYNLWWRQSETIKSPTCGTSGITVPANTSVFDLSGAFVTTPLTLANINIASGLAAKALSNKIYAAFSWNGCVCECLDWMSGLGGSYEFVTSGYRCAALQNWAVFAKCAVSF